MPPPRFRYVDLIDVSNLAQDGTVASARRREAYWHHRQPALAQRQLVFQDAPIAYSMLVAVAVPAAGGDGPEFADLRAVTTRCHAR